MVEAERKKGIVKVRIPTIDKALDPFEMMDNYENLNWLNTRLMTKKERNSSMKRTCEPMVLNLHDGIKIYCFVSEIVYNIDQARKTKTNQDKHVGLLK